MTALCLTEAIWAARERLSHFKHPRSAKLQFLGLRTALGQQRAQLMPSSRHSTVMEGVAATEHSRIFGFWRPERLYPAECGSMSKPLHGARMLQRQAANASSLLLDSNIAKSYLQITMWKTGCVFWVFFGGWMD